MDVKQDKKHCQAAVATTLGDLIFAIMEAAEETCTEGESAGVITQAVLGDLFGRSNILPQ